MENLQLIVFGANGMLGRYLCEYFSNLKISFIPVTRKDIDAETANVKSLKNYLESIIPKCHRESLKRKLYVINACGLIVQRKETSLYQFMRVNAHFPWMLQELSCEFNYHLIHISTDCVFDGQGSLDHFYKESDRCNEHNDHYAVSKQMGEILLQDTSASIFRTSIIGEEEHNLSLMQWLISNRGKTVNGYANHFWNGVTCLELAKVITEMILQDVLPVGKIQHVFSGTGMTKHKLLEVINQMYKLECTIQPIEHKNRIFKCLTTENKNEKITKILRSISPIEKQLDELYWHRRFEQLNEKVVLVTAFFDLAKREENNERRNAQTYMEKAEWLFQQNVFLVIFVEPENVNYVRERRTFFGFEKKTDVIEMKFEDLPWFDLYPLMLEADTYKPLPRHFKDSLLYHLLVWNKFGFVETTIKKLQLKDNKTYCGWIDFGIKHVAVTDYVDSDNLWEGGPCIEHKDKIRLMALNPISLWNQDISEEEEDQYLSVWRAAVGEGFWMGNPSDLLWLANEMRNTVISRLTKLHRIALEGSYLATILKRNRDRFSLFYGEHASILANARYMHHLWNIPNLLQKCREQGNWSEFVRIGLTFYVALEKKCIFSPSHQLNEYQTRCIDIIQETMKSQEDFIQWQAKLQEKDVFDFASICCSATSINPLQWLKER